MMSVPDNERQLTHQVHWPDQKRNGCESQSTYRLVHSGTTVSAKQMADNCPTNLSNRKWWPNQWQHVRWIAESDESIFACVQA